MKKSKSFFDKIDEKKIDQLLERQSKYFENIRISNDRRLEIQQ